MERLHTKLRSPAGEKALRTRSSVISLRWMGLASSHMEQGQVKAGRS